MTIFRHYESSKFGKIYDVLHGRDTDTVYRIVQNNEYRYDACKRGYPPHTHCKGDVRGRKVFLKRASRHQSFTEKKSI